MSEQDTPIKAKKPLNRYYTAMPYIFKTTGEIKRLPEAKRYSRELQMKALRASGALSNDAIKSLAVSDGKTVYILNAENTRMLQEDNGLNIESMILNGFSVFANPYPELVIE